MTASATFAPPGTVSTLDIDGSTTAGKYDALTDGLLIIRYMLGRTGASLTDGAVGATATRNAAAIKTKPVGNSMQRVCELQMRAMMRSIHSLVLAESIQRNTHTS